MSEHPSRLDKTLKPLPWVDSKPHAQRLDYAFTILYVAWMKTRPLADTGYNKLSPGRKAVAQPAPTIPQCQPMGWRFVSGDADVR
ncbi:hypothetical protein [Pseudomonas typographi]|uniref:Uncharacterized protein n=1 Tax=Pseudomonas typographi TaxID=2715964 RepID=A0ABR7Z1E8_9PSED|nr:hypothetical protein [Pseudomonas typographi]MBD1554604.1 hypothetical protein [Pseudomonas typographi]MBD1589721.1 hypothetical protein [Pseudomonas typographi]MBD1599198.1 hypothetical protein [Pseudomonas typographi]